MSGHLRGLTWRFIQFPESAFAAIEEDFPGFVDVTSDLNVPVCNRERVWRRDEVKDGVDRDRVVWLDLPGYLKAENLVQIDLFWHGFVVRLG